jgi:hypothetical protein
VAERLQRPHLLIFKDLQKVLLDGRDLRSRDIDGLRTLHVADLVTEASSYFRAWMPAMTDGLPETRAAASINGLVIVLNPETGETYWEEPWDAPWTRTNVVMTFPPWLTAEGC